MSDSSIRDPFRAALEESQSRRTLFRRLGMFGIASPMVAGLLASCGGDDDDDNDSPTATTAPPGGAATTMPAATTSAETPGATAASTEASSAATNTAPVAATEERGGDLTMAWLNTQEPANLDSQVDPYASATLINSWVTDSLILLTTEQEYVPFMATAYEANAEGTEWTLRLRDDILFQDGTPFNAEAFKANIDRIMDPETLSALRASSLGSEVFGSVEVVDESTAKIIYTGPWVTAVPGLAATPIWSPAALEEYGDDFTNYLTGCGAFTLTGWAKGSEITFEKWPDYKGSAPNQDHDGPAYLDTITVKMVGEQAILGEVLRTGEVNIVYQLPFQSLASYQDDDDFLVVPTYQGGSGNMFNMNLEHPPLDDLRVRQALRHSYDPQDLNDTLYDGVNLTVHGPLTSYTRCYWDGAETAYPYDAEKSKQLLEEAGWLPAISGTQPTGLILPAFTIGAIAAGLISRLTRSTLSEVLNEDYVRTARAKGLRERRVVLGHAFKNAIVPVITIVGLQFGAMLSGAVIVETVFSRPGLGSLVVNAILWKDYPLVQGTVFFIAVSYVLVNLLVDMFYAWMDPRIHYS